MSAPNSIGWPRPKQPAVSTNAEGHLRRWPGGLFDGRTARAGTAWEARPSGHARHNVRMNIVILDDYQDAVRKLDCAAKLEPYAAKVFTNTIKGLGQLSVRLRDADIIVLIRERTHLNRLLIEKLPKLKLIAQTGRVGGHVDVAACTERGIAVAEGVGSPVAPAELTWALIMAANKRLPQYIGNLKHGAWQQSGLKTASMPANFGLGTVLREKTMGIFGYGRIGQIVSTYARAFGMRVLVWGRAGSCERAAADGHQIASSQQELFANCDVVSLHLRLNEETRGIVTLEDLSRMKPTSLLVNTSRAELIEPDALLAGLNRGRPGMAAVDVFESEPILQGHALLRLENCICTPHIGYVELQTYEMYFNAAFDNVLNFIKGTPTNIVNPGALQVRR
jgi:D-3-phosphoglycerate dehydrogenase